MDVDCALGRAPCLTATEDSGFEVDEAEIILRHGDVRRDQPRPLEKERDRRRGGQVGRGTIALQVWQRQWFQRKLLLGS